MTHREALELAAKEPQDAVGAGELGTLDKALGEGWDSDVDYKLQTLGGGQEANAFQACWAQWRQRRMDSEIPKAITTARPKTRF